MLHLVTESYEQVACGLPIAAVNEEWTDASLEVLASPAEFDACPKCLKAAKATHERLDREDRREWALEEGMLQGIGAYNEIMGND